MKPVGRASVGSVSRALGELGCSGGAAGGCPGQSEVDYSEHCRRVMVGMTGSVDGS